MTADRLTMRGIAKSFGANRVLDDVEFRVAPGEVVALLGANGAGKSTLMKILTGVYTRDEGTVAIDGTEASIASPAEASRAGISFLPQEVSVIPDMSVAENVALTTLARRHPAGGGLVAKGRMRENAGRILDELGFGAISSDAFVGDLPVAEQRIVEIARALATDATLLVMDEPTASLSEQEAETIFRIVRRLKENGTSVVYISHYLSEVFAIADRIAVLRDGRNAGDFIAADTNAEAVVEAMLGRAAGALFTQGRAAPPGETVLDVEGLTVGRWLRNVSFDVGAGETVGVFGLVGSGVESLGRAVFGALGRADGGTLRLGGAPYEPSSPGHGKARGIGFVTAERKSEGILPDLSVRENLVLPFQRRHGRGPFTDKGVERAHARSWIERLGVRTSGPEQPIRLLSGGNQQKICVARWLGEDIRLLILEEPTRGVDVGARRDLYDQLAAIAENGMAILVLSSDVEEVAGLSDRSLVMDRGRVVGRFGQGVTAGELMAATAHETRGDETHDDGALNDGASSGAREEAA